ncbi:MAG: preprotein translocase subunit SecE [Rikenellaceae bacterium]|nr:preprotein translocase subunit SecE [Rikenellaceae bacterium]MDE7355672.1 preprotein translocase subunit SecE [Rikenellaceae bacterium]
MKLIQYVKDSYRELVDKVSWPSVNQLRNSAIVVMVASLLFALVIVAMDQSFENIMKAVYSLLYTSAN